MFNKIKLFGAISGLIFLIAACGRQETFTIKGELTGWESDSLVIQELFENSLRPVKTVQLEGDGSFEFSDTAANPRFFFLQTSDNRYISLLVIGGQDVKFSVNKEDFNGSYTVDGSPESELVWELNSEMRRASLELDSLSRIYNSRKSQEPGPELDNWIQGKFQDLKEIQRQYIVNFINKNYESPASILALSHQLANQPVLNAQSDFEYFEKVDSALFAKYPESVLVSTLHNYVEGTKEQQRLTANATTATSIGQVAPEIALPNPDGVIKKLSDFRGKYVLVDFWAGWCAPCRRENPNLVAAYAKYKDKGFEIFGVSLDRTRDQWLKAIEDDNLTWTQVSEVKYWDSEAARAYGVNSIPRSFLLDREGKIIAKEQQTRGPALQQKLKEIFE